MTRARRAPRLWLKRQPAIPSQRRRLRCACKDSSHLAATRGLINLGSRGVNSRSCSRVRSTHRANPSPSQRPGARALSCVSWTQSASVRLKEDTGRRRHPTAAAECRVFPALWFGARALERISTVKPFRCVFAQRPWLEFSPPRAPWWGGCVPGSLLFLICLRPGNRPSTCLADVRRLLGGEGVTVGQRRHLGGGDISGELWKVQSSWPWER